MHRLKIYIEIETFRVDLNIHNSVGEGSFFSQILVHRESVWFCTKGGYMYWPGRTNLMSLEASVGVVNGAETLAIRLVWHLMLFKRSPQWMSFVCRILLDSMNNNEDGLWLDAHVSIASCLPRWAFANFRCTVATRASSPPARTP